MDTLTALEAIGCSRRQLDYLTRCGVAADMNVGSGCRREWDTADVVRLAIAYRLASAIPTGNSASPWPTIARAALDPALPAPPRRGYSVLTGPDPVSLRWAATWPDVRRLVDTAGTVVLIDAYDLDDILGDVVSDLTCALAR